MAAAGTPQTDVAREAAEMLCFGGAKHHTVTLSTRMPEGIRHTLYEMWPAQASFLVQIQPFAQD